MLTPSELFKIFRCKMPRLGIISGAGPEAGGILYIQVAREFQRHGAWRDAHFPFVTTINFPFVEMLEEPVDSKEVRLAAQSAIEHMISYQQCDYVVIACNTLHLFIPGKSPKQFINLVELTKQALPEGKVPLVFASKTSAEGNLHGKLFGREVEYYDPEKSQVLIDAILAGKKPDLSFIEELAKTRTVVLGCTEYSAALAESYAPFIDPLKLVAQTYYATVKDQFVQQLTEAEETIKQRPRARL